MEEQQEAKKVQKAKKPSKKRKQEEKEFKPKFAVYADGSANNIQAPHNGGWAYVILDDKENIVKEDNGKTTETTNNKMELTAICNALWELPFGSEVDVYSDSKYSIGVLSNKSWRPKENLDIIEKCKEAMLSLNLKIHFKWVKGHNGDKWNEYVDKKASYLGANETKVCFSGKNKPDYGKRRIRRDARSLVILQELVFSIEDYQATKRKAEEEIEVARQAYVKAFNNAKDFIYEEFKTDKL